MISIPSNNFKPVILYTQEDTNHIFNACKLLVIATVPPLFHLQLDYGTPYQLMLPPSLASMRI